MATHRLSATVFAAVGAAGSFAYFSSRSCSNRLVVARTASREAWLHGRQAIVVGGTSGIGHGLALRLAQAGCSVTVVGRSSERGVQVVSEMHAAAKANSISRNTASQPEFSFKPLDCFSLPACVSFANSYKIAGHPLDLLVLTQGMATLQGYTPTPAEKGALDEKLTLHYYSRVVLMTALAPILQKSADGRCLSVLSAGVHASYKDYAKDVDLSGGSYSIKNAADCAGFYNDIAIDKLSEEHPGVSFVHASPGFISTAWGTEMPSAIRALIRLLQKFGRSKEDCAEYLFRALYGNDFAGGGFHLVDEYGDATAKVTQLHKEARDKVWSHTQTILSEL